MLSWATTTAPAPKPGPWPRNSAGEVFDSIFVLTRETDRRDLLSALLDLNPRRLFCEKPLVAQNGQEDVREDDFATARDLLQRAKAQGCETAMIFNYRFFDQPLKAKELIAARDYGQVNNISGLVHYACWSHAIDLVHHFAGPIVELTALQGAQVRGEKMGARIHLRDLDGDMEVLDHRSTRHETYAIARDRSRWQQYDDSFTKSIRAYLETLRQNDPPPVPGLAGLQELQVEAAIKRSIATGRPVDLDADLPLGL